jgi:anti-sigma factor RsiW
MSAHVSEHLTALLDGELPEAERAQLESHLRECATCASERDLLAGTMGSLKQAAAIEPSDPLRRSVLAAIDAEPEGLLARLRALLSARVLIPSAAALAAVVVLIVGNPRGPESDMVDIEVAQHLDLLQDYDVVAMAMPSDIAARDMDVVAHLNELGE